MSLLDVVRDNPTKITGAVSATFNVAALVFEIDGNLVAAANLAVAAWVGVLGAAVLPARRLRAVAQARQKALDDVASLKPAARTRKKTP